MTLATLLLDLERCNSTLSELQSSFDACGCGVTPCQSRPEANYDYGLHVGALFIVLAVSCLGATTPILLKYGSAWARNSFNVRYAVACGKLVGTGIVLACGLIHMLQPASQSLSSPCVPWEFNTDYQAYAFLYSLLAIIVMHFAETLLRLHLTAGLDSSQNRTGDSASPEEVAKPPLAPHTDLHVPHDYAQRHVTQSYVMELALTVHSVFIGLTVGVVGYNELVALLTAMCFHQFFEGIALGSRLADAEFGKLSSAIFILIFAMSAPTGIACGIAYTSLINPGGITYLLVEGTFDGICSGLLLYVGLQLLLIDFPNEIDEYCRRSHDKIRRLLGLFASLWVGAGFMAYIGKYL